MNKTVKVALISIMAVLLFSSCPAEFFHPGEERTNSGNISVAIMLGGTVPWADTLDGSHLIYTVTFSGGEGGSHTNTIPAGGGANKFTVIPGIWTISAEAHYIGELIAVGSRQIQVNPGNNGSVELQMQEPDNYPSFTVSFNSNGGSSIPSQTIKKYSKVFQHVPPTFDNKGFDGWYKEVECITPYNFDDPVIKDITLFAKWESSTVWPLPDLVRIEGGTFTMGSPSNEPEREDNEGPQHQVTVSTFYMGKYEVTQAEYEAVMGTNPSYFKGSNLPVEQVSCYDAADFCNRLSQQEGLTPAYTINGTNVSCSWNANGYRLPTEAEWEYACRAGTTTPFSTGNNITTDQANYNGNYPYNNNATGIYRWTTTSVGSFASNPWGLYDMHGNVWEWCWDLYGSYSSGAQTNPRGPVSGDYRVLRGGYFYTSGQLLRSAHRGFYYPSLRDGVFGFRLARN